MQWIGIPPWIPTFCSSNFFLLPEFSVWSLESNFITMQWIGIPPWIPGFCSSKSILTAWWRRNGREAEVWVFFDDVFKIDVEHHPKFSKDNWIGSVWHKTWPYIVLIFVVAFSFMLYSWNYLFHAVVIIWFCTGMYESCLFVVTRFCTTFQCVYFCPINFTIIRNINYQKIQ